MNYIFLSSRIQEFFQGSRAEQVALDDQKKLLHGQSKAAEEFLVREEQIDRQSCVNLDHDRVFGVADKAFDTQVLCDFLEEKLDLPSLFVNAGNCFGA